MIFSYNWLQKYFEKPLPAPQVLAELLTMHIAEVEGIEEKTIQSKAGTITDFAIDVKILPDRGCYGYGHLYLAREINAFTDCGFKSPTIEYKSTSLVGTNEGADQGLSSMNVPQVHIEDKNLVPVFTARLYKNIDNTIVPEWIQIALEAVGQRSISFIVDITNYIMMDIGQPMHAFDVEKVLGDIQIRFAKEGERVVLLDGREVSLDPSILVIADSAGPLDIAGVKGGKKAEVTADTKHIILTAGNFNSAYIRSTTQKVGIKNDSTKRYENGVTYERVFEAQEYAKLILTEEEQLSTHLLAYGPLRVTGKHQEDISRAESERRIEVSASFVAQKIGAQFSSSEIQALLQKVGISSEVFEGDVLHVHPPVYRQDLHIKEDIVEEVGRLHGYHTLKGVPSVEVDAVEVLPSFYFSNVIRATLVRLGFSEIYTHSLVESGDIPLANPLSADRSHMRNSLVGEMERVLIRNIQHLDALKPGIIADDSAQHIGSYSIESKTELYPSFVSEIAQDIRVFEIGHVFAGGKEDWSFAMGVSMKDGKKVAGQIDEILQSTLTQLTTVLGCDISTYISVRNQRQIPPTGGLVPCYISTICIDLQSLLKDIAARAKAGMYPLSEIGLDMVKMGQYKYEAPSEFPYIVRDIAVFIPGPQGRAHEVREAINSVHDPLIVSVRQFDQFEKRKKLEDGSVGDVEKTSYAFRIVFQSTTETLTEAIVQEKMNAILNVIQHKEGWEVR